MADLYRKLGEEAAIRAVVDDFYDAVLADDRVNGYFEDVDMERQRQHQTLFLIEATGGPAEYDGAEMEAAHDGLGIDDDDFDVIAEHLLTALDRNGVPDGETERVLASVEELRPAVVDG